MALMAKCPNSKEHKKFTTTAHEMHEWKVDEKGDFIEDMGCLETTHGPDLGNCWICDICGADAIVKRV